MTDSWSDQLSAYLDGELTDEEAVALGDHLDGCDECRTLLGELRNVVERARSLPDRPPETDLWPAIAQQLEPHRPGAHLHVSRSPRRVSFTLPQLAAAAAILMMLSGGTVWLRMGGGQPAPQPIAASPADAAGRGAARFTSNNDAGFQAAVTQLQDIFMANRDRLDPTTVATVEQSLEIIDRAIDEARTALAADPADPYLLHHLDSTIRKKIDMLQRATRRIPRAST